jgi:oligopeptide/dipeptide ABC transporter ATP-binding protein
LSQIQLDESQSNNREPILRVQNLTVTFTRSRGFFDRKNSAVKAVDNVSFDISQSQLTCIVGESGSGKTTLARCIARLTNPISGSIRYNNAEVTKLSGSVLRNYRRDVQMIFQDPFESLDPGQDVYSAISTPMRQLTSLREKSQLFARVSEVLEEVGLIPGEVIHRYPHQLSGGQRQRVNIARALATNPKLLIADEPITMLDAAQRMNVLSLLLELKEKRHLTVLMITHDLVSARITSQKTLVMYMGKLVEIGETTMILKNPHHPYVETLLESSPSLTVPNQFDQISRDPDEERTALNRGCVFLPRCKYATQVCSDVSPPLEEKTKSHLAACHNPLNRSIYIAKKTND